MEKTALDESKAVRIKHLQSLVNVLHQTQDVIVVTKQLEQKTLQDMYEAMGVQMLDDPMKVAEEEEDEEDAGMEE